MLRKLVHNGKVRMVEVLLSKERFNLDAKDDEHGDTVLHVAAKQGNCMMVNLLLHHGANVSTNMARQTPSDLAKQGGHEDCVNVLACAMQRQFKKPGPKVFTVSKKQGVVSVLQKVKGLMHMQPMWVKQYAAAEGTEMKLFASEKEMREGAAPSSVLMLTNADVWRKEGAVAPHYEFFLQQAHEGAPLALSCSDPKARTAWIQMLMDFGAKVRTAAEMGDGEQEVVVHGDAAAELVTPMFIYSPTNSLTPFPPDPNMELHLVPGEELELLEINDEGYCLCLRQPTGQKGWAPGNYLTMEVARFKATRKGKALVATQERVHTTAGHHHVSHAGHHAPAANGTVSHSHSARVPNQPLSPNAEPRNPKPQPLNPKTQNRNSKP